MATTRTAAQRTGFIVSAAFAAMLMVAAPAGAQTYTDGGGNNTGTGVDNPDGTDPDGTTGGGTGNADGGDLGQVDDGGELAFTGGDALSLVAIGGAAIGAGAVLVAVTRRKDEQD